MDFSTPSGLAAVNSQIQAIQEEFQTKMQSMTQQIFGAFFVACPEIKTIKWTQYIPSFNDGDACEFTLNGPEFSYTEVSEENDDEEDLDTFEVSSYRNEKPKLDPVVYNACIGLDKVIGLLSSEFEFIFGNNVEVFVTRNGVITNEYDCGY